MSTSWSNKAKCFYLTQTRERKNPQITIQLFQSFSLPAFILRFRLLVTFFLLLVALSNLLLSDSGSYIASRIIKPSWLKAEDQ